MDLWQGPIGSRYPRADMLSLSSFFPEQMHSTCLKERQLGKLRVHA